MQDNSFMAQGPMVEWKMPTPLGPLVRYFPSSVNDPPSYGFVVALGDSTLDLMVATANYRGLIPKGGVRHAHDPNNWRHRDYMGGIWLDVPFNMQIRDAIHKLENRLKEIEESLS
jgi:hypothetical protein